MISAFAESSELFSLSLGCGLIRKSSLELGICELLIGEMYRDEVLLCACRAKNAV